ncbi:MAG: 4-hydroxy-3-methylbut-2-enyl diphosphate reductase [Ignavibacteria bacterium]
MEVRIDNSAGFCWGVVRAIDFAERELKLNEKIYSLGDIIHNTAEVNRLYKLGLETITIDDFPKIAKGSRVLIRAHGEPPLTYQMAVKYGIEVIDATCPVVTKVQERIRKFASNGFQVVIYGKKDHAEVVGLNGVTDNKAIVVISVQEALEKINFTKPTVLFSQTTMDRETFTGITNALKQKIKDIQVGSVEEDALEFYSKNTICGQVSGRDKKLRAFARDNDMILFTAGKKSSNGKVLYNIAREENQNVFFIESTDDIKPEWFGVVQTVGITGATSTPQWLMLNIKNYIENMFVNI